MFFLISERGYIDKSAPQGGVESVLLFDTITNLVKSYHIVTLCFQVMKKIHNFEEIFFEGSIIYQTFAPKTRKFRKEFPRLVFVPNVHISKIAFVKLYNHTTLFIFAP